MRRKFFVVGTILGGVTLFVWGAITHMLLPWPDSYLREFKNDQAVVEVIKANSVGDGVYMSPNGIFATVSLHSGRGNESQRFAMSLITEFITNLLTAFLIAVLVLQLTRTPVLPRALLVMLVGFAGASAIYVSDWNWWGFSTVYILVEFVDRVMGWFLAGLVLSGLMEKWIVSPSRS